MIKKIGRGVTRRQFLATGGLAYAGLSILPQSAFGANERLTLAYIGVGGMGNGHVGRGLGFRDRGRVNIAAVCDVDSDRLGAAAERVGSGCGAYSDYRELLERKDIDAVVIASPDHWHALQTIDACEAGKHVYVEKPTSCTVVAGRAMVDAARRNDCIVQVGSQGRSGGPAQQVANYVRNGKIGRVRKVTLWHDPSPSGGPTREGEPPPHLDWDMWLGPLSMRPYVPGGYHLGRFRWIMESGGGQIRDRGSHMMSTALWCIDADGQAPVSVEASGDPRPDGTWDVPARMKVVYTFKNPDWELIWEQPGERPEEEPTHGHGRSFGTIFHGEKDSVVLFDAGWFSEAPKKARDFDVPPGGVEVYRMDKHGNNVDMNHTEEWLQAITENRRPCMDVEIAHRAATLNNLGNLSYVAGRKLEWDGEKEEIVGDEVDYNVIWKSLRRPYV